MKNEKNEKLEMKRMKNEMSFLNVFLPWAALGP
jgi:hypothetical protein